jgi:hypothetical protein
MNYSLCLYILIVLSNFDQIVPTLFSLVEDTGYILLVVKASVNPVFYTPEMNRSRN